MIRAFSPSFLLLVPSSAALGALWLASSPIGLLALRAVLLVMSAF